MATPCIEDSFSISLGMDAGKLEAALIRDADPANHLLVSSSGVMSRLDVGQAFVKVNDTEVWFYNDDAIHYHQDTRLAIGPNPGPFPWTCLVVASWDPAEIDVLGGAGAAAAFQVGQQLELVEVPSIFDSRVIQVNARGDVAIAQSLLGSACTIAFTVNPGGTGTAHWFRWVQRINGAVPDPAGYHWTPATVTTSVMRVG